MKHIYPQAAKMTAPPHLREARLEELTVWVDPLDGTKEYTEGLLDHVTILIGIAVGDDAVAGVIHQPYYNYKAGADGVGGPAGRYEGVHGGYIEQYTLNMEKPIFLF